MTIQLVRRAANITPIVDDGLRQVRVVCSTGTVDRQGDTIVQTGINLDSFRELKTVLWNHDQDLPIAKCIAIELVGNRLEALVEFPPEGTSAFADEKYRLIKAGVINAVSIGFGITSVRPVDKAKPKGPFVVEACDLWELSFVSVPANPEAEVVERSLTQRMETRTMALNPKIKGLYQVSQLADQLAGLGWLQSSVEWEAEAEGDGSTVPAKLLDAMRALGQVLIDMTIEEVSELVRTETGEPSTKRAAKLFAKRMVMRQKAGRAISAANGAALREACKSIKSGHDAITDLLDGLDGEAMDEDDEDNAAADDTEPPVIETADMDESDGETSAKAMLRIRTKATPTDHSPATTSLRERMRMEAEAALASL